MTDAGFDLELAATSLVGDGRDIRSLLKVLVSSLSATLGERLQVERKGGLLHRSDEIKSVRLTLTHDEFAAVVHDGRLECTVGHSSGGIRIRTETVDVGEWTQRLLAGLQEEAARSQDARLALENLVIGGPA
ncbi:MAG TPA: hypothetical protein VG435_08460 [Acidimicrobiales bacterium]|nr:hypothetical protein [Acidimicrobiales bacterium]